MTAVIEPSALWQALQDVDDRQEPHAVYERVMSEVEDVETIGPIEEPDHHEADCQFKYDHLGYCPGTTCVHIDFQRVNIPCPCKCHESDDQ